jgi:hypothetical protein
MPEAPPNMQKPNLLEELAQLKELIALETSGISVVDAFIHPELPTSEQVQQAEKVLDRLLHHPLMDEVWKEIFRRKSRNDFEYEYPSRADARWYFDEKRNAFPPQCRAAAQFFGECFREALHKRARSKLELENNKREFEHVRDELRSAIVKLKIIGLRIHEDNDHDIFESFQHLANALDDEIREVESKIQSAVVRRPTGERAEVADKIRRIAKLTRHYFGQTLAATVARIVNVIFDAKVATAKQVENVVSASLAKRAKSQAKAEGSKAD